jgi:uncharacterized damage-inducible protein DinB
MTTLSKALLVLTATSALVSAQTKPAADPLIAGSHDLFTQISGLIMRSADKIPDNLWSFQATPEVRTIGQLFAHIADASNHICATAVGAKMSTVSIENTAKTKAEIVAGLKKEFAACEVDYATMKPAAALEVIDVGGQKRARITELDYEVAHTWEHYGNLVTYMRLKGIIPPSSEPAAK